MIENDNNDDFKQITESNYTKISTTLSKIGYTEGITTGRDSVFQNGFDQGYTDGLKTGFAIAKFKTIGHFLASKSQNEEIMNEANVLNFINISEPKSPEHFKLNENLGLSIIEISKIQNRYTNDFLNKIQNEFPIINSLC